MSYSSEDLCILVPTKDRPQHIARLLKSIAEQHLKIGRIIIVDGGESVEKVVLAFQPTLPVEYYTCLPPGQIRQRNDGIAKLDARQTSLVAFFDDDLILEHDAIQRAIDYWNTLPKETAAVVLNIVGIDRCEDSILKWLRKVGMLKQRAPGQVLKSGRVTHLVGVDKSQPVHWALGGATIYRTDIVLAHQHKEIYAKRAVSEDLIYSYPIAKKYPMYVCAEAKVLHDEVRDHVSGDANRYYAYSEILWNLYFVSKHKELSMFMCVSFYLVRAGKYFLKSLFKMDAKSKQIFSGYLNGLKKAASVKFNRAALEQLLAEDYP